MAHAVAVGVAGAALAVSAPAAAEDRLASPTVMVQLEDGATAEEVAARHGLTVARSFPWIGWHELATPPGTADAAGAKRALDADGDVAATDALARGEELVPLYTPKDPMWQGGTLQTGEAISWNLAKANFPAAWDRTTGQGASIGIIDSEFDQSHPDLQAKVRNPYNTSSGTPDYHTGKTLADKPEQLHGTHVAGTAAASTDNGIGVSGAGFDATFVPVKINTSFTPGGGNPVDASFVADLTEALGYMGGQNVGVVNMSLGTTRSHQPLADAVAAIRAKGITVVAAAGNFQQEQPNAAIYPASYPGVIAVANTQANDSINPSSSNGNWVDVAAPGTNIVSTWDRRDPKGSFNNGQDTNYHVISGTSMAAPLVAGLVGLMKAVRPDLSPDEVETLLKGTTRDLGSAGPDPQYGSGLVDANAAVSAAAAYVRPAPPAPPAPPPPPPPPPAPPADTLAPKVSINGLVTVKGRLVTTRFKCAETCRGTVRVRTTNRKLLGSKSFTATAGRTVSVRVRLKRKVKPNTKVIVEVAARDGAGNLATKSARRQLRR